MVPIKMIGNAVPVNLAFEIAREIRLALATLNPKPPKIRHFAL